MINFPSVWLVAKNYENVEAICPFCENRNVYNRKSDLNDLSPIMGKEVRCNGCHEIFRIIGDIVNSAYEMLIFDCTQLKKEKRYIYCILNICQSLEMFFALYLRVYILYKPFAEEKSWELPRLDKAAANLFERTKDLSFSGMRALFLNHIILTRASIKRNAASLDEADVILNQLQINIPSHDALRQVPEPKFADLLIKVSKTQIGNLRNKAVHKMGYRPSLTEVEDALSEVQQIEYGLLSFVGPLTDTHTVYRTMI